MQALVTGGAGFIGCHIAKRLSDEGWAVTILDDLSRAGSRTNLRWLESTGACEFVRADVRESEAIANIIAKGSFETVIHLAAQVAVTSSVRNPRADFEINALGTLNVLEAIRLYSPHTILLNASTNKVYGKLEAIEVQETAQRYEFVRQAGGICETQPLEFSSPYGCSKGSADQYVNEYAATYGLRCVNFRQSCVYGYRQLGMEDQGWVSWFIIAHALRKPITIYGNGKQVRDVLFIDDLVDAYQRAIDQIESVCGETFNIGGGTHNALSLLELIDYLELLSGRKVDYALSEFRPGDQRIYISDNSKIHARLQWSPSVSARDGIARLYDWVERNQPAYSGAG